MAFWSPLVDGVCVEVDAGVDIVVIVCIDTSEVVVDNASVLVPVSGVCKGTGVESEETVSVSSVVVSLRVV